MKTIGRKGRVKACLKRNKIFFDTICSVSLSIMAIIVSILSFKANLRQIDNEERLNQPIIKIEIDKFPYYSKTGNDSELLRFQNVGGKVNYFDSKVHTFLKVEADNSSTERYGDLITIYVRITDFYGGSFPKNNVTGELTSYINLGNLLNVHHANLAFNEQYGEKYGYTIITLDMYAKVTYSDFRDEKYERIFRVDGIHNRAIKSDEIEELLEDDSLINVSVHKITAEFIKDIVDRELSKETSGR